MKSAVIVGAGGFGREVLEVFKDQNRIVPTWDILGFVDENEALHGDVLNGYPVLGGIEWLKEHERGDLGCVCAIGDCRARKRVVGDLRRIGVKFWNAIHPSVVMSDSVQMGEGIVIAPGCVLTVNIRIGNHVHIDTNCSIAHDAVLEDFSRVNPGVRVSGGDRLEEGAYVGAGATLLQQVRVGEWATVGAGAVVVDNIPAGVVAAGVPAKVVERDQRRQ